MNLQRESGSQLIAFAAPFLLGIASFTFLYHCQWLNPTFYGYDAYYHAKFIEILKDGIPVDFPWLAASMPEFNDHHFLYHVALALFFPSDDLLSSGKLSSVVFGTILVLTAYFFLRQLKVGIFPAFLTSALVLYSAHLFLYRILLVKANAFSLILILLFIVALMGRKPLLACVFAFLTGWAYVGFPILLYIAFLHAAAVYVQERRFKVFYSVLWVGVALAASQIINPYFPNTFKEVFEQLFSAGLTRNLSGGGEWRGTDLKGLIQTSPVFLYFALSLSLYLASLIRERKWNPDAVLLILFTATLLFLTLKHKRFIEYSLPLTLITGTYLLCLAAEKIRFGKQILVGFLIGASLYFGWKFDENRLYRIAGTVELTKDRYTNAAKWLERNSPKGSLVVTADWDDFPLLFFSNTHNVYLLGLDPNFLFKHDPEKYLYWEAFSSGEPDVVADKKRFLETFRSNYVFIDNEHRRLYRQLKSSPNYSLAYEDVHASVFVVN